MKHCDFIIKGYPNIQLRMYPPMKRNIVGLGYRYQYIQFPSLLFALQPYLSDPCIGYSMLCVGALVNIKDQCHVCQLPISGIHQYAVCLDTHTHFAFKMDMKSFIDRFWQTPLETGGLWKDYLSWLDHGCIFNYYYRHKHLREFLEEISQYPRSGSYMR
jgi:hypothetical protein